MTVFAFDALADQRWDEFLLRHPGAGVFHSRGWLEALSRTYGFRPQVLTHAAPAEPLRDGLVFCEVASWITGRRLVSLPFSDHCEILSADSAGELELLAHLLKLAERARCRYVEIRPIREREGRNDAWQISDHFALHRLQLEAPAEKLFAALHKDCIQRKVRRAEKEELQYEKGRSPELLRKFYGLMLRTRRRHCLPPQSFRWFQNLVLGLGDAVAVHLASKQGKPVAAILTLSFKDTLTYKYGCSDERFNALGGTPFVFWKAIQEAKEAGLREFDLGRSDPDNQGLITFKDRLGAQRTDLQYWRPGNEAADAAGRPAWLMQAGKYVFRRLPDPLLVATGRFLYRHIG